MIQKVYELGSQLVPICGHIIFVISEEQTLKTFSHFRLRTLYLINDSNIEFMLSEPILSFSKFKETYFTLDLL